MGIRFECPNGHHLHVKQFLAGKRGICPDCDARFVVPAISGRRVEAIVEAVHPPQAAPPMAAPVATPVAVPEIKISALPRTTVRRTHRDRRLERAKSLTLGLGVLVLVLLVVMVIVLVS